jgi:alkanesulfonate monooxygenase SsuD/methylene tetrahydromethanopterin reductase-like flavin-dependent oxidoreductase (luciferase family)
VKIGFIVLLGVRPELGRPHGYPEVRDMAVAAEAAGFDSVWLYDHLLYRSAGQPTRGIWECWTMLSALADATKTVELGTLVLCNQFRHPAILAKMAVTLDEVCNGRLILGIGAGWNEPEFRAFGLPFDHRVGRLEEALHIIAPLLRTGRVDFTGTYYEARDCEITPRGPRAEGPSLLVAGSGPRMLRLTAQFADMWNPSDYVSDPKALDGHRAKLDAACEEAGRAPSAIGLTAHVPLAFPDLGEAPASSNVPAYMSGSTEELAAAMQDLDRAGAAHLMCYCAPYNMTALQRLADAARVYRAARRRV